MFGRATITLGIGPHSSSLYFFLVFRYMLSTVRPFVVCLSVTLVRRTQPVEIFRRLVPWPSVDVRGKFHGGRRRGTPPLGG